MGPEAIFPKKDRPRLDFALGLILGGIIMFIVGAGVGNYMVTYNVSLRKLNTQLQKMCLQVGNVPFEDKNGYILDCVKTRVRQTPVLPQDHMVLKRTF